MKIWRVNNHHSSSNGGGGSSSSRNNNVTSVSNDVVILGGTTKPTTTKKLQSQQQQTTKSTFEMKDSKLNLKNSNHRMSSLLFLSSEPNPPTDTVDHDDARNDTTTNAMESSSPNVIEKKEMRKPQPHVMMMNIGRNNKKNSHHNHTSEITTTTTSPGRKSSSRRDLPEGEVAVGTTTSTTTTNRLASSPLAASMTPSSTALSRLLFNKQHMEQREQMKVVYTQFGPSAVDLLTVEPDDGMPSPEQADHVIVKVQASTVTLDDCLIRRGFDFNILDPICLPQTPGHDIVGHICARGSKVDPTFEEGDRVAALIRTGGNSRFVSIPSSHLVKIPRNIDSAEAVAMVSTFTTAYQTLKRIKQQGPMFSLLGKRVLILGGMDGVGQALIQMCLKARAEIYAPCPKSCHNYMQNVLGAHPLPEDKDQWILLVESQMDYVFDGVCEDGLETSQKALTADGELVCYGHTSMLKETEIGIFGAPLSAHMNKLWSQTKSKAKTIDIWESYKEDPETYKKNLKSLCQLLKWNKIKPNITCRVGLSEVADAQTKLENGELHGTIVCLPWSNVDNNK